MPYLSKKTLRQYNYALISLMIAFTFIYMYVDGVISTYAFIIIIPSLISGVYFLAEAYHRTKKEL